MALRYVSLQHSSSGSGPPRFAVTGLSDSHLHLPSADVARKTKEVEHMLANLENEGVEIDGKIATIIDEEVARIKAEAVREKVERNKLRWKGIMVLISIISVAYGFLLGVDWSEDALYAKVAKIIVFGEK